MFKCVVRGARGTLPTCGKDFLLFGGNTTCYSIHTDEGIIIIDAGTGISHVAEEIHRGGSIPPLTILFTHFHIDHVIGLPGFFPLYSPKARVGIMADPRRVDDWQTILQVIIGRPFWPLEFCDVSAAMALNDLPVTAGSMDLYGVRISWFSVPHPQQCLAYKVEMPGNTVVISTDTEYEIDAIDPAFIAFCRKADSLVFDAQFTPEEYPRRRGWGHSTWKVAARIAAEAGVRKLVLSHHAPERTDDALKRVVDEARGDFPDTVASTENLVLE